MPTVRQADVSPEVWARLTGATGKPARTRKPATPKATVPHGVKLTLTLPCVVVSEANRRDHWTVRQRRFKGHADAFRAATLVFGVDPPRCIAFGTRPLAVTLTRLGGRTLDDDNLRSAFKGLRDEVARWIGLDDGDERLTWRYGQEQGNAAGVRIELEVRT